MTIKGIEILQSPDYKAKLIQCIHCGLCLQACPTYAVFGTEMDSPRGRIVLMRAAAEGRIGLEEFTNSFTKHLSLCLACRACETACPSGVKYGILVDGAQAAIAMNRRVGAVERFIRWLGMHQLMPNLGLLKLMARVMWLYEITGVQKIVRALAPYVLPRPLRAMEEILPPIEPKYRDYRAPAPAIGEKRGEVAFFIGCIQEAFLAQVNEATIRVLQRNGYEVHFPAGQTCCGAAHIHQGEHALARELARRNIDAFLARDYDAIISNAGGCGATLKDEIVHLFHDDPVYYEKAKRFAAKVKDISEFLATRLHVPPQGRVNARVTYADSCHLRHVQKVVKQPRDLLKSIPGIQLIELKLPDRCCGSAGVYNIVQAETADAILDAKMQDIASTGAEWIIVSNTGCHMQLIAGSRKAKLNLPVYHVVQVLDMSYRAMERGSERA
ncbi:MAG: (Fe-S)-binding protein [Anaerolineae bacterium]|nr:(Fe-S)-binding protein [Anaerolineae bacterium]